MADTVMVAAVRFVEWMVQHQMHDEATDDVTAAAGQVEAMAMVIGVWVVRHCHAVYI